MATPAGEPVFLGHLRDATITFSNEASVVFVRAGRGRRQVEQAIVVVNFFSVATYFVRQEASLR